jgi:hypothetical protein
MDNAAAWIVTTLKADAQLTALVGTRFYVDEAPEGTVYPFVVMQQIDAVPVQNAFADRIMDGERWQVKAVTKSTSWVAAKQIAERIEIALHKKRGSNVISSVIQFKMPMFEKDTSGVYRTMILDFRVHTQ